MLHHEKHASNWELSKQIASHLVLQLNWQIQSHSIKCLCFTKFLTMLVEEFILHPPRIQFWFKADFILVHPFAWFYSKSYIIDSDWDSASQSKQNVTLLSYAIRNIFKNSNTILCQYTTIQ